MSPETRAPAELMQAFENQIGLCRELEQLADALPGLDRQHYLRVARTIRPLIIRAREVEEALLFPQLVGRLSQGRALVDSIRMDQLEDEYFAEEVTDHLLLIGSGRSSLEPEAIGYMLRGFFDGIRRRIRHEQALLARLPH